MCAKLQENLDKTTKLWKSSSEETAERILSMILDNNWQEGHKLPPQRALAETLGVSRPTVREALVILETMGKVNIQPGKGVFLVTRAQEGLPAAPVTRFDRSFIAGKETQIFQFRHAIEPAIAALVALNATQAQIDDMAAMLDDMKQASVRGDVQHFAQLDFAFHTQMIEAANNPFFIEAMRPFFDLFSESQRLPFSNQEGLVDTMREHAALLEHLRSRNSHGARLAMEEHVVATAARAGVRISSW
ncbi:FadR/GntR family transcriptional regulator [uncultured Desulfovibrio sp.]|uniref:FadR/GntR family transcriptional regulator n=1 Tax=uncultured Desulfovibrio sp. TaxID=167968 RepID=UPI002606C1E6|nr:FadR/GntR family transcriptional regulator [uncultured Desulfovibrio sp.]